MKKKILLFGPFGDFGGRELETSFIASVLSSKYHVDICTSSFVSANSQIFDFNKNQKVFSIKELVFKRYLIIRITCFLSYLKNRFNGVLSSYANNAVAKRYFNYDKKVNNVLEELVSKYDLIFICAQLCSGLVSKVIEIAENNNIKIIFRTTGAITDVDFEFIEKVNCFLHHSLNNAEKIENYKKHNFLIIDQCAYNEKELLNVPLLNKKVKTFVTVSRLVKEKNVDVVLKAFLETKEANSKLFVIGDGDEYNELKKIADGDEDIIFTGFVSNKDLYKYFLITDCLIISHFEFETGPLTGIEAMASSKLIISAKTGAMKERMPFNEFWFDNRENELAKQIKIVQDLTENEVSEISIKTRDRYLQEYSEKKIERKYLDAVDEVFANRNRK